MRPVFATQRNSAPDDTSEQRLNLPEESVCIVLGNVKIVVELEERHLHARRAVDGRAVARAVDDQVNAECVE